MQGQGVILDTLALTHSTVCFMATQGSGPDPSQQIANPAPPQPWPWWRGPWPREEADGPRDPGEDARTQATPLPLLRQATPHLLMLSQLTQTTVENRMCTR